MALAEAGDIAGLQAFEINPVSSGLKALARYRDLCVIAIAALRSGGSMKITREFCPSDRYDHNFGLCSSEKGWAQVVRRRTPRTSGQGPIRPG